MNSLIKSGKLSLITKNKYVSGFNLDLVLNSEQIFYQQIDESKLRRELLEIVNKFFEKKGEIYRRSLSLIFHNELTNQTIKKLNEVEKLVFTNIFYVLPEVKPLLDKDIDIYFEFIVDIDDFEKFIRKFVQELMIILEDAKKTKLKTFKETTVEGLTINWTANILHPQNIDKSLIQDVVEIPIIVTVDDYEEKFETVEISLNLLFSFVKDGAIKIFIK